MTYLDEKEKKFIETIEKESEGEFLERPDIMDIHYIYSVGELTKFFKEVRDNEKLFGTRCTKCGFGFFPPRLNCQKCYASCEWVELSGKGEIEAGTLIYFAVSNFGDKVPLTIAFIKMDEMDMAIRHTVVMKQEDKKMENLKKGTRVRVQFKPKNEREGRITDFYFVPDK
ncbi:MAG TPA: Zn-ribbon domain-containing OB-fold protein [Candidatus Deferrimicrobium sp.]|nr:Zn-ribbon domain-containing OB-fold protein [Candidatus Deferrimicrobium sp.]